MCVSADVSGAVGSAASVSGFTGCDVCVCAGFCCLRAAEPSSPSPAADAALQVPSSAQTLPAAHRPAPSAQLLSASPVTAGAGAAFL